MKKVMLIAFVALGAILFIGGCGSYNTFVNKDTEVENKWGDLQSTYQRRADLIPNLVNTVKGVADFEQNTIREVTEARAKATSIQIDAGDLTPEKLKMFQQAQSQLSGALSRLLAVSERYPELKATQNFSELQAQLEGTENRINVARDRYNDAVSDYNRAVRTFPSNIFAGLLGFQRKAVFEADPGADKAPEVNFE